MLREPGPQGANDSGRLFRAGAVSLLLHWVLLQALFSPRPAEPGARIPQRPLRAHLATAPPAATVPVAPVPQAQEPVPPVATGAAASARPTLTERPRFEQPPDFSEVEGLPLTQPLRLALRIHVAAPGRATRIEVLETRLVPSDFLAAVTARLQAARYLPGRAGSVAVDASFDLVIEAAPSIELGDAAPRTVTP